MPDLPGALCKGVVAGEPYYGPHVCGPECDGPRGCYEGKSETGRFNRIQAAKRRCFVCPVRDECLTWALETDQDFGIWGGKTEGERRQIRKKQHSVLQQVQERGP